MTDRPLITFALFAYNQEKFIREAVEGAFAQTYSPLDIILSDDCSSDGTFQIMQEMAASYGGPHLVKAQKTPVNAGILAHVLSVANKAKGELIVLAAGDDISLPHRVITLCDTWRNTGAWGLCSRFDRINEVGEVYEHNVVHTNMANPLRSYFTDGKVLQFITGATSAYDRRAFTLLNQMQYDEHRPILCEDGVMMFLLHAHNKKVVFEEESLVRYRAHDGSLSNSRRNFTLTKDEIIRSEKKAVFSGERFVNLNHFFLSVTDQTEEAFRGRIIKHVIESDLLFYEMLSRWTEVSTFERFRFLAKSRRWKDFRWMLPRLFGIEVFACTKFMMKKIL